MYTNTHNYENMVELCVSTALPSIRNMTTDQLTELLYSDERIENIIDNLSQMRSLPSERESILAQNKSLAEWNLGQEPRLEQLKCEVRQSHETATRLRDETEELHKKLATYSSENSVEILSNLLQVAAQEVDEEAEKSVSPPLRQTSALSGWGSSELGSEFTNGDLSFPLFQKDFLQKKTQAHVRKVKSDRLTRLLNEQSYGGGQSGSNAVQYRPPSMPQPTRAPYPDLNRHSFW